MLRIPWSLSTAWTGSPSCCCWRTASTHSAIIPLPISIPSAFQMPTSWNVADGQPRTSCRRFTVMRSLTRSTQWRSRPFQRSKIRSNINYHSNNKSPAERQIQRPTGYFICRQRGSNPHGMLINSCVGGCCCKIRSKSCFVYPL